MDYTEAIGFIDAHGVEMPEENRIVEAVYFKSFWLCYLMRYETRTSFAVKELTDMYSFQDCLYYTIIKVTTTLTDHDKMEVKKMITLLLK